MTIDDLKREAAERVKDGAHSRADAEARECAQAEFDEVYRQSYGGFFKGVFNIVRQDSPAS